MFLQGVKYSECDLDRFAQTLEVRFLALRT